MRNRNENPCKDRDARVRKEASGKAVAEDQECSHRRNNRLNIQNDVHDGRIAVFQRECEEDGTDCRASETREEQVSPGARADSRNLVQTRDQNRQKHDQDEHVLPKDDYFGVKQRIERDAPRALGTPKCGAEADQPWTVRRGA